jgi:hypothetical protein
MAATEAQLSLMIHACNGFRYLSSLKAHRHCNLSSAGLGTASATSSARAATALARKVAAGATLSAAVAFEASASTAARGITSARTVAVTTVCCRLGATRLDNDVLAIYNMWIGGDSSLVALDSLVLNKSAVLEYSKLA